MRSFGDFAIVREISGGGMMDIFVALAPNRERVVLRILKERYARDRRLRANFLRNAEILARMDHPNIVKLVTAGEMNRMPFTVQEYIEAGNLREAILHRAPLLTMNQLSLLRQMAATLSYVHNQGILHLDFKPENHLLTEDGRVILIDFDLALEYGNKPVRIKDKEPSGTPAYIAPELFLRHQADERADIFSFGVTGYEMLCYHKPFEGKKADPRVPTQTLPGITPNPMSMFKVQAPPRLELIIRKCLALLPEERYPSMILVIKELEDILTKRTS